MFFCGNEPIGRHGSNPNTDDDLDVATVALSDSGLNMQWPAWIEHGCEKQRTRVSILWQPQKIVSRSHGPDCFIKNGLDTPSPRCQRGCWCPQRRGIYSCCSCSCLWRSRRGLWGYTRCRRRRGLGMACSQYDPRRCKTSSVGQSAGLLISRSAVRFRQKLKKGELKSTWIWATLTLKQGH